MDADDVGGLLPTGPDTHGGALDEELHVGCAEPRQIPGQNQSLVRLPDVPDGAMIAATGGQDTIHQPIDHAATYDPHDGHQPFTPRVPP